MNVFLRNQDTFILSETQKTVKIKERKREMKKNKIKHLAKTVKRYLRNPIFIDIETNAFVYEMMQKG